MDAIIYQDIPLAPDKQIGRIDRKGKVYAINASGTEEFVGSVNYDDGEIFDEEGKILGWVEDDGEIIGHYEDDDEDIGYVTEDGEIYGYDSKDDSEVYRGKIKNFEDLVEGAAAMLLFFDREEFEEGDE